MVDKNLEALSCIPVSSLWGLDVLSLNLAMLRKWVLVKWHFNGNLQLAFSGGKPYPV